MNNEVFKPKGKKYIYNNEQLTNNPKKILLIKKLKNRCCFLPCV